MRPVHQVARDELAVGDDHALVVAVDDRGGADVDPVDLAGRARDGDDVADPDRPFQQQDDAADEVGDDLLEAEAEAHAQGRQDHADLRSAEVNGPQRGDDRDRRARRNGRGSRSRTGRPDRRGSGGRA